MKKGQNREKQLACDRTKKKGVSRIERWVGKHGEDAPFVLFDAGHIGALLISLLLIAAIVVWRKQLRSAGLNRRIRLGMVGLLLSFEVTLQLWYGYLGEWSVVWALPLQLCSVTLPLSAWMLWTRSYRLYELMFFWGIGGALQALVTPSLDFAFPHVRFIHFFAAHAAIIAAAVWMTAVEGYRPRFASVGRAMLWLNVFAGIVFLVNAGTGANYMFLARKPGTASLLDVLLPWPWYIVQLELIALVLFVLMWWFVQWFPAGKHREEYN